MNLRKKILYYSFLLSCLLFTLPLLCEAKNNNDKKFTVIIDAGHGGKDTGAIDNGVKEKDINLAVALQLEELIKKKMKDAVVVMTRNNDSYLTLQQRADKANKAKGDLFISIHTNSVDANNKNRKTVSGSSVYALGLHKDNDNMKVAQRENSVIEFESNYEQKYSGFDPTKDESYIIFEMAQKKNLSQSLAFAKDVKDELVGIGRNDRGVHQAGFWVLWATSMPAVLVELDFICNPESAAYMTSKKGEKELAEAIFKAVDKYEKKWEQIMAAQQKAKSSASNNTDIGDYVLAEETGVGIETAASTESVAQSKSRRKKVSEPPVSINQNKNHQVARKRRSAQSREKSSETSHEVAYINPESYGAKPVQSQVKQQAPAVEKETKEDKKKKKEREKAEKKAEKEQKKLLAQQEKAKRKENAHNAKVGRLVTVYRIQILASEDYLKQNNERFCGLAPISTYKENNLYKYYYGESSDKKEIETMLSDVRKKIPDAFIVSVTKSR